MRDDPKPPPGPRPDTWNVVMLRNLTGDYLRCVDAGVSLYTCPTPVGALSWPDEGSLAVWKAARPAYLRRRLATEGWHTEFIEVKARRGPGPGAVEEHAETRPMVAEAAGFQ